MIPLSNTMGASETRKNVIGIPVDLSDPVSNTPRRCLGSLALIFVRPSRNLKRAQNLEAMKIMAIANDRCA